MLPFDFHYGWEHLSKQHRHILGLDLVRFAAALGVTLSHYGLAFGLPAAIGVQVFFTLSGFVIAFSAEKASALAFARSRALRLLPAAWICATISLAVMAWKGNYTDLVIRYAHSLVLWPNPPWVDGVYWTLPVEIAFYLAVFLVLAAKNRFRLELMLNALIAFSAAYWFLTLLHQIKPGISIAGNIVGALAIFSTPHLLIPFGCFFAIGGLLYICFREGFSRYRIFALACSILLCCVQVAWAFADGHPLANWRLPILFWFISLGLIVLSVWGNRFLPENISRIAPAIRLMGLATYPLYLLHGAVQLALAPVLPIGIVLVAAIAASLVIAAFIEPAIRTFLRALFDRIGASRKASLSRI